MQFNQSLSILVTSWTGLETSFGAIAQLKSFLAGTKAEDSGGNEKEEVLPSEWPNKGHIQMRGVTAKYK
jgi:hypothetical protein